MPTLIRWPGVIKPGTDLNDMSRTRTCCRRCWRAAGEPDIKQELLEGYSAMGRDFKVHLDGYNLLPYLKGEEESGPRKEFLYWTDDGDLAALRYDQWKLMLPRATAQGFDVWQDPFVELRLPKLFNLRADPFERADEEGIGYDAWRIERLSRWSRRRPTWRSGSRASRNSRPARRPATFSIDQVMDELTSSVGAATERSRPPQAAQTSFALTVEQRGFVPSVGQLRPVPGHRIGLSMIGRIGDPAVLADRKTTIQERRLVTAVLTNRLLGAAMPIALAASAALLPLSAAWAQDQADLAKAAQNPVAAMISLPFQNNTLFGVGPDDDTANVLNIQPVIPFTVGEWNIISRTIAPLIYLPDLTSGLPELPEGVNGGSTFGLGDINQSFYFSPAKPGPVIWGIGPSITFPTATDENIGSEKWSAGPAAVALAQPGPWVIGSLIRQLWSFAGDGDRQDVSQLLIQPFVNYNMADGWYLVSAPIITANWEADSDNTWTVPAAAASARSSRSAASRSTPSCRASTTSNIRIRPRLDHALAAPVPVPEVAARHITSP